MKIDRDSAIPVYRQICDSIIEEIADGYLIPEDKLPSRRELSRRLGVCTQTVESAYSRLVSDGYITARRGSGYYVSGDRVWDEEHNEMQKCIYNFSFNGVETSKMPFVQWSRLMRSTLKEDRELFRHGEKAGEWCLRKSIRRLLFRTRGVRCRTDQIIIGPGAEDLLRMAFGIFAYDSRVIQNNYFSYRVDEAAKTIHCRVNYLSDNEEGPLLDELERYRDGVLYLKPTHSLPTGVTLDEDKRTRIADWSGGGRYIIEDSGEADFVYGKKHKTLWEMTEGKNVMYLGSFSGTVAPSMKIGYAVMPDEAVKRWFEVMPSYSNRVSRTEQVTLSRFIDLGYYEKHTAYMKSIYGEKTLAAKRAIAESAMGKYASIAGDDAGLFLRVHFGIDCPESEAKRLLNENGVKITALSATVADKKRALFEPNTYIMGYGDMTISQIKAGIRQMEHAWSRYL